MKICLKCLKYYKEDMVFCPECAERLADVDASNQPDTYVNNASGDGKLNNNSYSQTNEEKTVYVGQNLYAQYGQPEKNKNSYNSYVQPDIRNGNNHGYQQPPLNNSGQNKWLYALIGIFGAIIVVAGIIIVVLLVGNGDGGNETVNNQYVHEVQTQLVEETVAETTTRPVTQPPTTEASIPAERLSAYSAFNDFYVSYLDSINLIDSSYLSNCSSDVRYEMIERFQYNQKSIFDLRRIDFDEESYSSYTSGGKKYHSFYVKCVSEYYDRFTYANKGYNYAVWYVTVTQEGDYCYVSFLERNDKYKMNTNVHTITDYSDINYLFY